MKVKYGPRVKKVKDQYSILLYLIILIPKAMTNRIVIRCGSLKK
jgi:hypothetical protein